MSLPSVFLAARPSHRGPLARARQLARLRHSFVLGLLLSLAGCTLHHSKQALSAELPAQPPTAEARFVTEEDSGLSIFGLFMLAEPDHYAVLLERLRRDHRCARLLYPQLDFYTDHWFLIAFPISRVTSLCEPEAEAGAEAPGGATPIPAVPVPAAAPARGPEEASPYSSETPAPSPSPTPP
jgi:hypothetical protein